MPRPNLLNLFSWTDFEERVLEVFRAALVLLGQEPDLPRSEDPLNRRLLVCLRRANLSLRQQRRGLPSPVLYECVMQPVADDVQLNQFLWTRPDFTWGVHDDLAERWEWASLFYHIECKRLGVPSSATWILNRKYTENGIRRFEDPAHGYGHGFPSGVMVGYMQTMTPDEILVEVNVHATNAGFPALTCSADWTPRGVTDLDTHRFTRRISPTQFQLHHLWMDLQHHNFATSGVPTMPQRKRRPRPKKKPQTPTG